MDVHWYEDWLHIPTTKGLGIIFMFAFILNAIFVVLGEQQTFKNVYNTFRFLNWKTKDFQMSGQGIMGLGVFMNTWVIVWTCLDVYVVVGASTTPQDLLMDALGLLFLYNLDDIGGDLGFIEEDDWPGLRIAWIYQELVHTWPDDEFDEDRLDTQGKVFLGIYYFIIRFLALLLFVVPFLSCITPFTQIAPDD